jgi:hypothetical protein
VHEVRGLEMKGIKPKKVSEKNIKYIEENKNKKKMDYNK